MFGKKNIFVSVFADIVMRILSINKLNKLYDDTYIAGDHITTALLNELNVTVSLSEHSLKNIPVSGPAIVIVNHPTGALDGIMVVDIFTKIRQDAKFMGNFLLNRIEPMAKHFITVDPFNSKDKTTNQKGIRQSIEHLRNGGLLVIFPAGEVATWQKGFSRIEDKKWGSSIMRFIQKANVPVIPAWIEAKNSFLFHLAGKISPMLRTAMLPRELVNKKNKKIHIRVGASIHPQAASELTDLKDYGNYLRASVNYLQREKTVKKEVKNTSARKKIKIIDPVPVELLCKEIESIRGSSYILSGDNYDLYLVAPGTTPNLLKEIGRLRESTFRNVGEGTLQEIDNDSYDSYYYQLLIWDSTAHAIVGAYRMGFGDKILKQHGIQGFYTNTLFRIDKLMIPYMKKTIELGRTFIDKDYQRKTLPLLLLWKAIFRILVAYPEYEYLLGATSISEKYTNTSKLIIANYLKKYHFNEKMSTFIKPVNGMKGIQTALDLSLVENVESMELISRLVMNAEDQERTIPVLIKKYLQLSSRVLSFNVDRNFCNSLDALMLLEVKNIPEDMLKMVSR